MFQAREVVEVVQKPLSTDSANVHVPLESAGLSGDDNSDGECYKHLMLVTDKLKSVCFCSLIYKLQLKQTRIRILSSYQTTLKVFAISYS